MVGFTPQVSAAVWVGSGNSTKPIVDAYGSPEYGRDLPGKTWKIFMDTYLSGKPNLPLPSKQQVKAPNTPVVTTTTSASRTPTHSRTPTSPTTTSQPPTSQPPTSQPPTSQPPTSSPPTSPTPSCTPGLVLPNCPTPTPTTPTPTPTPSGSAPATG